MFTVELYAKIRHAVMVDGLSCREAAKRFGVHRNTIAKMLSFSVPPGYRRRERPASKKLGQNARIYPACCWSFSPHNTIGLEGLVVNQAWKPRSLPTSHQFSPYHGAT